MRVITFICVLLASSNAMALSWVYKISEMGPNDWTDKAPLRRLGPGKFTADVAGVPCEFTEANGKFRNVICRFASGDAAEIGIGCDYPGNQPLEMMDISHAGRRATVMLGCDQ